MKATPKKLCLFVFFFSLSLHGLLFGQPPCSDLEFSSQAELNSFSDTCTVVDGDLIIQGKDINDLSNLNNIVEVTGSVEFDGNDTLSSLSGLDNLETVGGDLSFFFNPVLTSPAGLAVTSVGGSLNLQSTDFTSFSLSTLTSIGNNFTLDGNGDLTSLSLNGLTNIGGSFNVNNNGLLDNLSVTALATINASLFIQNNPVLTTINMNSLSNIATVAPPARDFVISDNDALTTLSGIGPLSSLGDSRVSISGNELLKDVNALSGIVSATRNFSITSNPALSNLTALSSFQNLSILSGSVNIQNNSSITDIGLSSLQSVAGNFSLQGLVNLANLSSLRNLTTVEGTLRLFRLNAITSLSGLENVDETMLSGLEIQDNANLSDCEILNVCNYIVDSLGPVNIVDNAGDCANKSTLTPFCQILPVELAFFTARTENGAARLTWQTLSELNNDYFEIQHSPDGGAFRPVARVAGAGTTQEPVDYAFVHQEALPGVNYYRLKQVDFDGQFEYSEVATVTLGDGAATAALRVFPNPTTGQLTVLGRPEGTQVQVIDPMGRLVREQRLQGNSINLGALPAGIYSVALIDGSRYEVVRVVKH